MIDTNFYAGIGSRKTPLEVCALMHDIAAMLKTKDFVLRSGHAEGADVAFEAGADGKAQIWLPHKAFNNSGTDSFNACTHYTIQYNWLATQIAEQFHPNWKACSEFAKLCHTRNVYQVLGPGLGRVQLETVSKFVICWTEGGKGGGGTGQAIRIANGYQIPVIDLGAPDGMDKLMALGETL